MVITPEQLIRVLFNEVIAHRVFAVWLFIFISLGMLGAGLVFPKQYVATTTILIDETNIIKPLTEGVAVPTDARDYARVAGEIVNARKVIDAVSLENGMITEADSPLQQEIIREKLKAAIKISSVGKNLIKVGYKDVNPELAAKVANQLAELFVEESRQAKDRESQSAYEFIDKQVQEYHDKLVTAEQNLKQLRSKNLDAQPGSEAAILERINTLQGRYEVTGLALKEAQVRRKSIKRQLGDESAMSASLNREGQYHDRIVSLQNELYSMRLKYLDNHPDIVRTQHQIEDLRESILKEEQQRKQTGKSGKNSSVDKGVTINPLYQQLRSQLASAETQVETLHIRLAETEILLDNERKRSIRLHESEAALAEFTRDYDVNQDIYQRLLTRRERAWISRNLDAEGKGFNFRIQEPASIPVKPTGLRFLHYMIGGIVLGVFLPVLLIYAKIQIDPRLRFPSVISSRLNVPVLIEVPHMPTVAEVSRAKFRFRLLMLVVAGVLYMYGYAGWMKWTGSI